MVTFCFHMTSTNQARKAAVCANMGRNIQLRPLTIGKFMRVWLCCVSKWLSGASMITFRSSWTLRVHLTHGPTHNKCLDPGSACAHLHLCSSRGLWPPRWRSKPGRSPERRSACCSPRTSNPPTAPPPAGGRPPPAPARRRGEGRTCGSTGVFDAQLRFSLNPLWSVSMTLSKREPSGLISHRRSAD